MPYIIFDTEVGAALSSFKLWEDGTLTESKWEGSELDNTHGYLINVAVIDNKHEAEMIRKAVIKECAKESSPIEGVDWTKEFEKSTKIIKCDNPVKAVYLLE